MAPHKTPLFYGLHAIRAALANPARKIDTVFATPNTAPLLGKVPNLRTLTPNALAKMVGPQVVHQGVAAIMHPLSTPKLEDILPHATRLVFLDHLSDPHNLGAVLRAAAVFGTDAVVCTARHTPPLSPTVVKVASGAVERVPLIRVPNLARALTLCADNFFSVIGLVPDAPTLLHTLPPNEKTALVIGGEHRGLRTLTTKLCTHLASLATLDSDPPLTLNLASALAVALYETTYQTTRLPG